MKIDYIDALRGYAILAVLAVHNNQELGTHPIIFKILGCGAFGVQLFFLVSSITLFLSNENKVMDKKYLISFFIRRYFRIAPIYYLGIIFYLFKDGFGPRHWLGDMEYISTFNIISNFTFLHSFNPYWINSLVPGGWSIGIEMIFYLIIPFLFVKIKSLSSAINFLLFSLVLKIVFHVVLENLRIITSETLWNEYLYLYLPSQLPVFLLGISLYFIIFKKESLLEISKIKVFSVIFLIGICQFYSGIHLAFSLAFCVLIYLLSVNKLKFLNNSLVRFIGRLSFSIYISHFAIIYYKNYFGINNYVSNGEVNFLINFSLVAVISVFISYFLNIFVEMPFQNVGYALIKKIKKA